MTEVDNQLKLLEDSCPRLIQEPDTINSLLDRIEKRLAAAFPGVESWVDAPSCVGLEDCMIGFGKVGNSWRLRLHGKGWKLYADSRVQCESPR